MNSSKLLVCNITGRLLKLAIFWVAASSVANEPVIIPEAPGIAADAWLLMDASTGKELVEQNSQQRLPPASLTKIMTSYVAASELKNGGIKLDDEVLVSVESWKKEGSRMFIREGTRVSVEDLIRGIVIQSGNDASVALAEHIAGSEELFVDVMNQQADLLGMTDTHFMNATGLPDENHYTSARDLSKLTVSLINNFPEHYKIYSEKSFTYNNISQRNRNSLLFRDNTVDGVKTGYTSAAGYSLVTSSRRGDMRLITVVLGATSESSRANESQKLLTYGFRYFETVSLFRKNESLKKVRVWGGTDNTIDLGLTEDIVITLPKGARNNLEATTIIHNNEVHAPLRVGQELGTLMVKMGDSGEINDYPVVALDKIYSAGFFNRLWGSIQLFFLKLFGGDPLVLEG